MSESRFRAHIAQHLKSVRSERGLSLDATAKLTGVSKAMLGQIERMESSPTISKMWQIASGLDTSFSAFFATDPRLLVSTNVFPDDKNMRVKTVFSYQPDTKMEVFEIEMTDFHRQSSEPHAAGVVEHVCVQKGTLEIFVDGEWNRVNEGESLRFRADQEHRYRAMSELVRFQNIVCYTR